MTEKSVDSVGLDEAEFRRGQRNCVAVQHNQQDAATALRVALEQPSALAGPQSARVLAQVRDVLIDEVDGLAADLQRLVTGLADARRVIVAADTF